MEKTKLSFNKRVSLVKKYVFEKVTESNELNHIANSTGYYTIATIEKHFHVALNEYDIDFDMHISPKEISCVWYDCNSDNERTVTVDFSRIEHQKKLSLMKNEVQSDGAVKSYTRRYALTNILRLPSTDIIETEYSKQQKQTQTQQTQPETQQTQQQQQQQLKTVNQKQLKRYFAIAKTKEINVDVLDDCIKIAFQIKSKNDWLVSDYDNFTKFMNENTNKTIMSTIIKKIEKSGRKLPMSLVKEEEESNKKATEEAKEVFNK